VSTWRGSSPASHYVPSTGFLNLSTAYATFDSAGLLHPAATSRVAPSRGFSRAAAVLIRHQAVPPCRCLPSAH
jgi:hypothetical protein